MNFRSRWKKGNCPSNGRLGASFTTPVIISGANQPEFNGLFPVTYLNATSFTIPVATTAVEFGDAIIFDPDTDEESVADTKLTVITTADGAVCGMQKSGPGFISQDHIYRIVDIACERAREIREKFLEV